MKIGRAFHRDAMPTSHASRAAARGAVSRPLFLGLFFSAALSLVAWRAIASKASEVDAAGASAASRPSQGTSSPAGGNELRETPRVTVTYSLEDGRTRSSGHSVVSSQSDITVLAQASGAAPAASSGPGVANESLPPRRKTKSTRKRVKKGSASLGVAATEPDIGVLTQAAPAAPFQVSKSGFLGLPVPRFESVSNKDKKAAVSHDVFPAQQDIAVLAQAASAAAPAASAPASAVLRENMFRPRGG